MPAECLVDLHGDFSGSGARGRCGRLRLRFSRAGLQGLEGRFTILGLVAVAGALIKRLGEVEINAEDIETEHSVHIEYTATGVILRSEPKEESHEVH